MGKTAIEYGERNWNFYPGCNGPDGTPCSYCWSRNRVLPRMKCLECRTLKPHFHDERMREPLHAKKPTRWLTCYTGDFFGLWVSKEIQSIAFEIMRACPQHTFLTLTKQPQNLAKWNFPDNCWVGVSATDWLSFLEATDYLKGIQAKVKYLSIEPLLKWSLGAPETLKGMMSGISWVIIGGVTKCPKLPQPKVEWVREIVEAANKAGVKVFLKNNLLPLFEGHERYEWAFRFGELRQEMPECKPV